MRKTNLDPVRDIGAILTSEVGLAELGEEVVTDGRVSLGAVVVEDVDPRVGELATEPIRRVLLHIPSWDLADEDGLAHTPQLEVDGFGEGGVGDGVDRTSIDVVRDEVRRDAELATEVVVRLLVRRGELTASIPGGDGGRDWLERRLCESAERDELAREVDLGAGRVLATFLGDALATTSLVGTGSRKRLHLGVKNLERPEVVEADLAGDTTAACAHVLGAEESGVASVAEGVGREVAAYLDGVGEVGLAVLILEDRAETRRRPGLEELGVVRVESLGEPLVEVGRVVRLLAGTEFRLGADATEVVESERADAEERAAVPDAPSDALEAPRLTVDLLR